MVAGLPGGGGGARQVARARLTSTQLSTYFAGSMEMWDDGAGSRRRRRRAMTPMPPTPRTARRVRGDTRVRLPGPPRVGPVAWRAADGDPSRRPVRLTSRTPGRPGRSAVGVTSGCPDRAESRAGPSSSSTRPRAASYSSRLRAAGTVLMNRATRRSGLSQYSADETRTLTSLRFGSSGPSNQALKTGFQSSRTLAGHGARRRRRRPRRRPLAVVRVRQPDRRVGGDLAERVGIGRDEEPQAAARVGLHRRHRASPSRPSTRS